jgi:hypothetical protein
VLVENKPDAPDAPNIPPARRQRRRGVLILLVLIVGSAGVITAYQLLHRSSTVFSPAAASDDLAAVVATEAPASQKPQAFVVPRRTPASSSAPGAGEPNATNLPASSLASTASDRLIERLSQVPASQTRITPELKHNFQALAGQGTNAIPAIRQFLQRNQDLGFDEATGANLVGYATLRAGLFDVLRQIGGPDTTDVLLGTLRSTADPAEIALLARYLEEQAPGQYRQEAVNAARETLDQTAKGQLQTREVGPLFQVLQNYGDANIAPDLDKTMSQWHYYATMALVGLQDGRGVAALVQRLQDPTQFNPTQTSFALQMLAQAAAQNPQAAAALLEDIRQNLVPDRAWVKIAEGLSGDQYQLAKPQAVSDPASASAAPGLKTYHIESGNQNFYSIPFNVAAAPDQTAQRQTLADQLLEATQNPIAQDALQRARARLGARPSP